MKKLSLLYLSLMPLIFSACTSPDVYEVFAHSPIYEFAPIFIVSDDTQQVPLNWNGTVQLGVHFPHDPTHVGSQLADFENAVGTSHQIYTTTWTLGDAPPETWLLELISMQRTPNIILTHGNATAPFELDLLADVATYLGQFHTPMLLQLFPEARQHGYNPQGYINFFRQARELFDTHAPHVSLVFTVNEHDILDAGQFFAGYNYVDILAINIHKHISPEGDPFVSGTMFRLDTFHQMHHRYRPILISFATSHFSTTNHVYHTSEAGLAIEDFYSNIINHYPNIFGIVYNNFNSVTHPTVQHNKDNFSITDNTTVLSHYRNAIQSLLSTSHSNNKNLHRSAFTGVLRDDKILIPYNTLVNELNINKDYLQQYLQIYRQEINGDTFYPYSALQHFGFKVAFCKDLGKLVISS